MATYEATRTDAEIWANRFHDGLARMGYTPADFRVESGGALGADGLRVATEAIDQAALESLVDGANSLALVVSETSIAANGVAETVISCAALGNDFEYLVTLDGAVSVSGSVADGTQELSVVEAGTYLVEIRDPDGLATGFVEIVGV
jgi:hypothetical protein